MPTSPGLMTDDVAYWYQLRAFNGTSWSTWVQGQFTWDAYQRGDESYYAQIPFDLRGGWNLEIGAHNGAATLSRSLFAIPTYGPPQSLELSYSSAGPTTAGMFGAGWSSNLTQYLSFENGLVVWHRADGGREAFPGTGGAAYGGHFESISVGTNDVVTLKNQAKLTFQGTAPGHLLSITNRFGQALSITGWGTATVTATDASGRSTLLAIDVANGRVSTVTNSANRSWTFTYVGSGTSSDLTQIQEPDPDGGGALTPPVTTLAYSSHQVTTVTRSRRTAVGGLDSLIWAIGYTGGKATSVIDPIAHASYSDIANIFTYNATNTVAAILKSYSPVVRSSTTYDYDAFGRATTITDPLSNHVSQQWNTDSTLRQVTDANQVETDYTYSTDGRGNQLTATVDATGTPVVTKLDYNSSNDVIKTYVAFGTADEVDTTFAFDTAGVGGTPGHLVTVTENSAGTQTAVTQYAYSVKHQVAAELDSKGITTTHGYDANGNETQTVSNCTNVGTTPPGDPAWKTCAATGTHDAGTNVTEAATFALSSTPGKLGLPDSATDASGRQTSFLYDALGRVTSETPPGGTTTREWDQLGNELRTTQPGPLVTTRILDLMNRTTTETGPGVTTTTSYDASGNISSSTVAGDTVSDTYDGAGNLLSETIDPGVTPHLNLVTEYAYDAAGHQVASRRPAPTQNQADLKTITRTFFDAEGRVTKVAQNCTNTGTTVPDVGWASCAGTGTKDATWNLTTTTTFDDRGNKTSETLPNGRVTTYTYDDLDQLIKQVDNDVSNPTEPTQDVTTEYAYDAVGNQTAVKSPTTLGGYSISRTVFDNLGRALQTIANCTNSGTTPPPTPDWKTCAGTGTSDSATNVVTAYANDATGHRLAVTSPDPSAPTGTSMATTTTRFAYDSVGRLCRVLQAASVDLQTLANPCADAVAGTATSNVSTRYTFNTAGNLATMIDANGHVTAYGYDQRGRITSLQDGLLATVAWGFDDQANTKTQTNRTDTTPLTPTITWTYDPAGRVVMRSYLDDTGGARATTYTYDLANNLASAVDGGNTISIVSDRLGRPTSVSVSGDAGAATTYGYSFTAPSRSDASGAYTMAVDAFGRITSVTDPIHASPFTWTYGADGQPTQFAMPNGNSTTMTYDPLGKLLTKVTGTRASYTYAYNRAGNRLTEASTVTGDSGNGTATFGYDPLDRIASYALPGVRTLADTWQAAPNRDSLTVDGVPSTQGYSAANRPNNGGYSFDADGRMTARPGAAGTWLEWDSLGRLVRVRATQGGAIVAQYTYDALDRLLTVERSGTRIRFRYQGATTSVAQVVNDVSGSVIRNAAIGPDGTPLEDWLAASRALYGTNAHHDTTWTADDTGAVSATLRYDPWGNVLRSSGTLPDWRFQGSWADTSTNLSWAIARWYSPGLGSFISEDTLLGNPEAPSSRHLYAYGGGEPVGAWDPNGRLHLHFEPKRLSWTSGWGDGYAGHTEDGVGWKVATWISTPGWYVSGSLVAEGLRSSPNSTNQHASIPRYLERLARRGPRPKRWTGWKCSPRRID